MSCNPEPKGLLRTSRFPALRVAGLCIGFLLLPISSGSGALCSKALLQHYIEPKDTYNFTYIHPLRNSPYIIDYNNPTWSRTTTCSTNSTWTSTSRAAIFWTLSTAWTTSMPTATDWHGDAEGHIHPCLHKPTARLQGVATTDQSLQAQAGVA